jgi:hypothetical protein
MTITGTLFGLMLLFGSAFGAPAQGNHSSGTRCATNSGANCVCPSGTDYSESVTWAVVGAPVSDVETLMNDCKSRFIGILFDTETSGQNTDNSTQSTSLPGEDLSLT